ncbi:MAG: cytochrome c family protein [Sphingopyxis sp.]|jgi:cytochrome c|nr:MAG: cytochrome c family protein [Sphingopyxis sp.]|tara:strand:- start:561 stop:1085 length:525 start_codon:yes stop_codon:yes gene_type:complete
MRRKIYGRSISNALTLVVATPCFFFLASCGQNAETDEGRAAATEPNSPTSAPETEAIETPSFASLPAPYNEADYRNGKSKFNQCIACHAIADGKNGLGPHLYGVADRKAGSLPNFSYSDALKASGIAWDNKSLDHWIENPMKFISGTKMNYAGLRNVDDRRDLIAYILVSTATQ